MSESTAPTPKKKSIFKKILVVLLILVLVFIGVVAMQPAQYSVTRTATVNAPVAVVFPQVDDLRKWEAWSPWAKIDPQVKNTFEGPPTGKGAVFAWAGNNKVGEGRMTITESRPNELVRFDLEFIKPMAARAQSEFAFKGNGNQTTVTWTMFGTNGFAGKAMCLVMNMDKMLGGDFERGLATMKSIVEAPPKP